MATRDRRNTTARVGLSKVQILDLVNQRGYFFVSLRYRDDTLRRKCHRMVRDGLMRKSKRIKHGGIYFLPKEQEHEKRVDYSSPSQIPAKEISTK